MRQLDQRRQRRGDGRPSQQTGRRYGADLMERRAQFERLLAAESRRHGWKRILLLFRELIRPGDFARRKGRAESGELARAKADGLPGRSLRFGVSGERRLAERVSLTVRFRTS